MSNTFYIQRRGPFGIREEILDDTMGMTDFKAVRRLGIQAPEGHQVLITDSGGGQVFVIGPREMLEFNETFVTSIQFLQEEDEHAIVDLVVASGY